MLPGAAFVLLLAVAVVRQGGQLQVGDQAPDFAAPVLAGSGSGRLADLRGRPVVINFWASWCGPCKEEAPLFEDAYARYGDQAHFVGVNIRDARSDALAFLGEYELDYLHVRDEQLTIYDDYGLTGQPETFFLDHEGVLIEHVAGPVTGDQLFSLLDVLVARSA